MNEELWNMAVDAHPELKGRDDVKASPKEFVALVKILGEVKREEENGNSEFSEYKNPDKALRLIRETKAASDIFTEALLNGSDNLAELMETPGYYAAQNLHENDFLPTEETSMKNLLNTHAPLQELTSLRNDLVLELTGNIYSQINCEIRDNTDIKEINDVIEQEPMSVLALMAVSARNKEQGLPPVRISNVHDLKAKLELSEIQELSAQIPLISYGAAIKEAYNKAPIMEHMNRARVLDAPKNFEFNHSYREIG